MHALPFRVADDAVKSCGVTVCADTLSFWKCSLYGRLLLDLIMRQERNFACLESALNKVNIAYNMMIWSRIVLLSRYGAGVGFGLTRLLILVGELET